MLPALALHKVRECFAWDQPPPANLEGLYISFAYKVEHLITP